LASLANGNLSIISVFAWYTTGQSSTTSGYRSGGYSAPSSVSTVANIIDKFSFSSDGNSTDVGDLTSVRAAASGTSSTASGYSAAGATSAPTRVNIIEKFPFASDGNATDVGDITVTVVSASAGQQY
jgi:hypothetical protein